MKKIIATIIIATICIFTAFAYTDNFYSTSTNPEYLDLISKLKNNEKEKVVVEAYNNFISNPEHTDVEKARIEVPVSRYYRDNKNKTKAREHVALMRSKIDAIDKSAITDFEAKVLEAEYVSANYYVDKKMSEGMKSSDLTKELVAAYPDDVFSILTDSWRLIYTPGIAGGSPKKAIRAVEALLKNYEKELTIPDKYSAYAALAVAHHMRDDYEKADKYFEKAFKIYNGEADIVESYEDNQRELKKISD